MRIELDLDGVICSEEKTFERFLAKPIVGAVESINRLKADGHFIVINTARGWGEEKVTREWLEKYNIKYDLLLLGKNIADIRIDDRAIRFDNWDDILCKIHNNYIKDYELYTYRKAVKEHILSLVKKISGPVLEIGPNNIKSNIFSKMPDTFVDTRRIMLENNIEYKSLDIDSDTGCDIVADITKLSTVIKEESFQTIICNSVLEHIPNVWDVPVQISKILKPKGLFTCISPWSIRLHGPRPDCWRISDDAFEYLFGKLFKINKMEKVEYKYLDPIAFIIEMEKINV